MTLREVFAAIRACLTDPEVRSAASQLDDFGGVGEGNVIVPCPNCREDVIVMWAGLGGDSIPAGERPFEKYPTYTGRLSYKKGAGECPTCGVDATPVLSTIINRDQDHAT